MHGDVLKRSALAVRAARVLALLVAAHAGVAACSGRGGRAQSRVDSAGVPAVRIAIRGNDGPTPGDVLALGQTSSLAWYVFAPGRDAAHGGDGFAHDIAGARLRWRSLAPAVVAVDSLGHVRAVGVGTGAVEATAVVPRSDTATGAVRDTMPFRVVPADPALARLRVTDASAPATSDADQTCAVTEAAGDVVCWRPVPLAERFAAGAADGVHTFRAPGSARFRVVATGMAHVCALTDAGTAYCWGENEWGEVGAGGGGPRAEPTPVAFSGAFLKIGVGRSHTCGVVATSGAVLCWGLGTNGALGPAGAAEQCTIRVERRPHHPEGEPVPCSRVPRPVPLPDPAVDVAAGDDYTCAVTARRQLFCWGSVYNIGFDAPRPRLIDDGRTALVRLAGGSRHLCGLDAGGRAFCWGRNWYGQLGAPSVPHEGSATLVAVAGAPPLASIAAGDEHTCAITLADARAICWGRNFDGQLGTGGAHWPRDDADRPLPVMTGERLSWRSVSAGASHSCGVTRDGALYCWGSGLAFRLAPGSNHEQPEPFPVAGWRRP